MENAIWDYCRKQYRSLLRPLFIQKKIRFVGVADWFIFSLFVLPSYFGIRLAFFDLTAVRLFEALLLIGIFKNFKRRKDFVILIKRCSNNLFIILYMCIVIGTNLIHPSLNTIFYWITNVILVIYLIAYLLVYEYGIERFLQKIKKCIWLIVCISPLELFIGKPPFAFLDTLNKSGSSARFGSVRIMGNCSTANGYAMFLMICLPLLCYDYKKRCVDLGKNKFLLFFIALNIFLTGSRLTIGTLILAMVLCMFVQVRQKLKNVLLFLVITLPIFCVLTYFLREISFFENILRTFFSAVDAILGSSYAVQFGANEQTLYNSTYYRELLFKNTILSDWLSPWIGKGGNYNFAMYIEGYNIVSVDNFYVGQYITYAWPGLILWILMSLSFFISMLKLVVRHKEMLGYVFMVSFICYYISLWYLDQLQTYPIMAAVFGMTYGNMILAHKKGNMKRGKIVVHQSC